MDLNTLGTKQNTGNTHQHQNNIISSYSSLSIHYLNPQIHFSQFVTIFQISKYVQYKYPIFMLQVVALVRGGVTIG